MRNARNAWLLALCAAAGIGCGSSSSPTQVMTGRVTTRGAVAIRAVAGNQVVTAGRVRSDGSFTLALPAGSTYRLDVLTTGGVKHVLAPKTGGLGDLAFRVCHAGAPWNLGAVGDGSAGAGSGSSGGGTGTPPTPCEVLPDGTTDCPPPPPPCDPSTGMNCPPPPPPPCDPSTDPSCPCQAGPDGTITCPPPPPPPPPCDPSTDPTCPCVVSSDGTTTCPPPPPPCDPTTDASCPTPPPPCTDPTDPDTCQDPCMGDPAQCGCVQPVAGTSGSGSGSSSPGTPPPPPPGCWPPPQPPQCDSAGHCDPTGVTPQFPPADFGCGGAGA